MYLFTRSRKFAPNNAADAVAWSVETAGKATQISGLPVTAWGSMWGEDVGTVVWSAFVDDLAALEEAGDKLAVDSGFNQRLADADAMFTGPVVDSLAQLIHGEPRAEPPGYVTAVTARLANGRFNDGIAAAIEIAQTAEAIGGHPTSVALAVTGAYGGLVFVTGFPDIGTLQGGESALNADPKFAALIDRVGDCFQADAQQAIYRRLV